MRRATMAWMAAATLLAAACDEGGEVPTEAECPSEEAASDPEQAIVTGTVSFNPPEDPIDRDQNPQLTVRGTTFHDGKLAIRSVHVGGVAVTMEGFNHSAWSVVLGYDTLVQLPVAPGAEGEPDAVTVKAVATDACGLKYTFAEFTVPVDLTPGVQLETLSLDIAMPPGTPQGAEYLPVSGTAAAVLTIRGGPKAAGVEVTLDATGGTFQGAPANGGKPKVTLAGSGETASATVLYFPPNKAGLVLMTATAEGLVATGSLSVAGPPSVVPSAGQLAPGQKLQLLAFTDGVMDRCQAQPVAGVSVTAPGPGGPVDLMFQPAAFDTNGDGRYEIDVAVDEDIAEDTTFGVSCFDVYGQFATASFQVVVPEPPAEPEPGQ